MRKKEHVIQLGQFRISTGFRLEHIKTSGKKLSRLQGRDQGGFIDECAAGSIYDYGSIWKQRQCVGVYDIRVFRRRGTVEAKNIANRQKAFQVFVKLSTFFQMAWKAGAIVIVDFHSKPPRPFCDNLTNAAHTKNPQPFA